MPGLLLSESPTRFHRDALTWLSYWMLGYFAFLEAVLGPIMPYVRARLRLSYTVASLHFSAFALGSLLAAGAVSRLTQRYGRRRLFWGGASGMAVGLALLAFAPSALWSILGALAMGVSGALLTVTINATLSDAHGLWSPVAMTEANTSASIFAILASAIVGVVVGISLDWRVALLLPVAVFAVVAIRYRSVIFAPPVTHTSEGKLSRPFPWTFWALVCIVFFETGVEWCVGYWGVSFLISAGSFSPGHADLALSAFFLAMVLGRFTGSRLTRRWPAIFVLLGALCVAVVGFPLFWLASAAVLRVLGLFVVGLGVANVFPVGVALAAAEVPDETERAMSRVAVATSAAILSAPFVLGALADHVGLAQAFGIAVPLLLVALAVTVLVTRWHVRGVAAAAVGTPGR